MEVLWIAFLIVLILAALPYTIPAIVMIFALLLCGIGIVLTLIGACIKKVRDLFPRR